MEIKSKLKHDRHRNSQADSRMQRKKNILSLKKKAVLLCCQCPQSLFTMLKLAGRFILFLLFYAIRTYCRFNVRRVPPNARRCIEIYPRNGCRRLQIQHLPPFFPPFFAFDFDGLLGLDFFENTVFTIDMEEQTIEVKSKKRREKWR